MRQRPAEILVVENDADLAEMVERLLNESLHANVTLAESAADAMREELTARHDLVLVSTSLPDANGLELTRHLRTDNPCPVILMADQPGADETIEAMRLGVSDILTKPFELEYLSTSVQKALEAQHDRRLERSRRRRLRKLVARIICDRRDLARRIDLICRDFVHAHHRLAEKVAQSGILSNQQD